MTDVSVPIQTEGEFYESRFYPTQPKPPTRSVILLHISAFYMGALLQGHSMVRRTKARMKGKNKKHATESYSPSYSLYFQQFDSFCQKKDCSLSSIQQYFVSSWGTNGKHCFFKQQITPSRAIVIQIHLKSVSLMLGLINMSYNLLLLFSSWKWNYHCLHINLINRTY